MKREEIELLVPESLLPCPRCQRTDVRKSMWHEIDEDIPYGWQVGIYCECGLKAPTHKMIDKKEKAAEKLQELISWWNTRTPQGHRCQPDHLCDSCAATECKRRSSGTVRVADREIPCFTSACNRYKPEQVSVVAVHNSGSVEAAECWTDRLPDKPGYYWYWDKDHESRHKNPEIVMIQMWPCGYLDVKRFPHWSDDGRYVRLSDLQTPNARWKFVCDLEPSI